MLLHAGKLQTRTLCNLILGAAVLREQTLAVRTISLRTLRSLILGAPVLRGQTLAMRTISRGYPVRQSSAVTPLCR